MTDFSKIYILAEDPRQQLFVRRYRYRAGYERHVIDPEVLPKGTGGAGEQWVGQRYSAAVAKYRKRATKHNIETWILHLSDKQVDEETDYHHEHVDDLIPAASEAFFQWSAKPPEQCLPSLGAGIEETKCLA